MSILIKNADKLSSNKKFDTNFKIDNLKKELLLNKYNKIICETCVETVINPVRESHCQAHA